ncbi:MAG: hypothetical protein KC503_18485 [Myxococcales bacterium]|nr:hypothetical protein [Myxococcales bacterium]
MRALFATSTLLLLLCAAATPAYAGGKETNCTDGVDNDGDSVYDCGDSDCKDHPACKPDGGPENTNKRCSDWIDNDGNGHTDCDDRACQRPGITVCKGSWDLPKKTNGGSQTNNGNNGGNQNGGTKKKKAKPDPNARLLKPGMSLEELVGKGGDKDGERNDVLCSDGIDNDGDGKIDCEDFGCRYDPSVTVCQGTPGFRFSVVARAEATYDFAQEQANARFSRIQLRALGPIPFIQDSFFLLSMRFEKTPRLTFAMFQVPVGKHGLYLNINSGGGGLSTTLVRSAHKRLLLDPAFYVFNAFQQGNGAAVELGGPIDKGGRFLFRAFVAGGVGRFSGSVGGNFIADDNTNFTWTAGAQIQMNLVGYYSRWDTPFIYTPLPSALSFFIGGKYDQRAQERYPAVNLYMFARLFGRGVFIAEAYGKRELEFGNWQLGYNLQVGALLISKWLMLAADFGQYLATEFDSVPASLETDIRKQLEETQWRAALHLYFYRNIGLLSVVFSDRYVQAAFGSNDTVNLRELKIAAQYAF